MEKRVLLASLLSVLVVALYSQVMSERQKSFPSQEQEIIDGQPLPTTDVALLHEEPRIYPIEEEEVTTIESKEIKLEVGTVSGSIQGVILKQFMDETKKEPIHFGNRISILKIGLKGKDLKWKLASQGSHSVELEALEGVSKYTLAYRLDENLPTLEVELNRRFKTDDETAILVTAVWHRVDEKSARFNPLEISLLNNHNQGVGYKKYHGPFKKSIHVPRGTSMLSLTERYFCLSIEAKEKPFDSITLIPTETQDEMAAGGMLTIPGEQNEGEIFSTKIYLGPRDYFYMKKAGFESAFNIGILGRVGLILLAILSWMKSLAGNYGLAIIVFSVLITCITAPFTLLSFRSMKKMQQLKPHVDRIMAKHKEDPKKLNQEVFALYKEHRVSPLGGCLPMVLQFPIFIAIFQAIPHFVELRGQSFLWIKDLSLPDRLLHLPFSVPFLGDYVNLLPVLMALAMYAQTKMSQRHMPSNEANPASKMFSGPLMSILFCAMFYNIQSALVLYWLTNSLMSLAWYRLSK